MGVEDIGYLLLAVVIEGSQSSEGELQLKGILQRLVVDINMLHL